MKIRQINNLKIVFLKNGRENRKYQVRNYYGTLEEFSTLESAVQFCMQTKDYIINRR